MSSPQAIVQPQSPETDDELNIVEYFDIIFDQKWLIGAVTATALLLGVAYALLATPIYEANFSVQVEDSDKSAGSFLGDAASSLLSVKTPAAGEVEVIRSRLVLGQAVENTKLYIQAYPKRPPIIGNWLARRATALSEPGFLGISGYVTGTEEITVPQFAVPSNYEKQLFTVTVLDGKRFRISHPDMTSEVDGSIGAPLTFYVNGQAINMLVSAIEGKPGAQFIVLNTSKQGIVNSLQDGLKVVEKGKQSGVLDVSMQSPNPKQLTDSLNEIARIYVRQNIERKAAEAEKTLGFLDTELPKFKMQLEQSEDIYNRYRNQNGTVSLDDEAKNALAQTVDLQSKLIDAQQKRRELAARFTDKHPNVMTLDAQISALNAEIASVDSKIRKMPLLQQSTLRMQRDIKVNTDLYVSLLNSSLQMRLAKEGKVGNVRLLDEAVTPDKAVSPRRTFIAGVSLILGFLVGIAFAVLRSSFFGGIRNPNEIEQHTGLSVYSSIPLSPAQLAMEKDMQSKRPGLHVLAMDFPTDAAIESLRSLRTALQFAMLQAPNNRILITGATPSVGKTFVSINFATTVAASGRKVLLIDADLRKGRINQFLSIGRGPGLSELIAGQVDLESSKRRLILPNLDVITTGKLPPNPAELLESDSFKSILENVSLQYDLVIVDTAPVLVAADTVSVAPNVGMVLLVARAEKTQLGEIIESAKRLSHGGGRINGVILNAIDITKRHYGSYGYKYGGYKYTQYNYQTDDAK